VLDLQYHKSKDNKFHPDRR